MKSNLIVLTMFSSLLAVAFGPSLASAHDPAHAAVAESFGHPGKANAITRTVAIAMNDTMRFDPAMLSVKQGETLRLRIRNDGKLPHEFVLGTPAEIDEHAAMMRAMPNMVHTDASSVRVAPGQSAEIS